MANSSQRSTRKAWSAVSEEQYLLPYLHQPSSLLADRGRERRDTVRRERVDMQIFNILEQMRVSETIVNFLSSQGEQVFLRFQEQANNSKATVQTSVIYHAAAAPKRLLYVLCGADCAREVHSISAICACAM